MRASVLAAAQNLDADALVELWELDTSALTTIFGIPGTGSVYRWTPGVLDYRLEGTLEQVGSTVLVVLERTILIPNTALHYTLQVEQTFQAEAFSAPIVITGVRSAIGLSGQTVSILDLASPLPQAPAPGMNWLIESSGSVWFGGVQYASMPIEVSDMEWSGQGKLPRPRLRISNIGGLATALVVTFGDIVGATITRRQTFKSFLDGEATPDSSATFEPDIFTVDRKSAHNNEYIEFELAALLDQQGIRLPRRIVNRDHCNHTYRQWNAVLGTFQQGSCPYSGNAFYNTAGASTLGFPANDICGKHLSDCLLRFGSNRLPFRGFPGVAEVVG